MFGIGLMLPVIPAAERCDRSSKKVQKRKSKRDPSAASHELTIMRRPSTIKTESTFFEYNDKYAVQQQSHTPHHQRNLSLTVDFDLDHAAAQLNDGEISDLELALFAFWVKAKHDNYLMAKGLVRELALDQGYNVDKIINPRVRKLLQEVHDIRPRFVPKEQPVIIQQAQTTRIETKDPRHASTVETPFQNQTRSSDLRTESGTRAVSSPFTARMDTLPRSLRLKRELAVQEAARSTMTSNDVADYPPNTPLSVKSRGSQISCCTPMATSILRSVSTPIRTQPNGELEPLPQGGWTGETEATETRYLSPSTSAKSSYRSTGDVFDAVQNTDRTYHNPFTNKLQNSGNRRYGTSGRYMYREPGSPALGPYQLDASDVASESSYGAFMSLNHHSKKQASTSALCDGGIIGDESFDALESYIGSDDEEQGSVLESASNLSREDTLLWYQFAVQAAPSQPPMAGPAPRPPQRRAAAEARRKTQAPNLAAQAVNFHRPLPLRSYESEASMFPTAGAQACSGHNRSKSVTSVIASRRSTTKPMAAPYVPDPVQARNSLEEIERDFYERNSSCMKISEQVNREATSTSQRSSSASTLAAFPIPPMDNPVGQLPMLVSRAVSSPQSLCTTISQHPVASSSLDDTYRAIIKVAMDAVLQRTRRQGKELSTVDWDSLTSFERAWREMNAVLLMTIYGRTDAVLGKTDIDYIDHVAEVLRSESGNADSMDWIRHMFEADA